MRTWDPRYDADARDIANFAVARIEAALLAGRLDCGLSYERLSLSLEWRTNPRRGHAVRPGGSPALKAALVRRADYDSVPLVVASVGDVLTLWDGHRRLETYRSVGRSVVPAWHARFTPGTGVVSASPSVGTGTGSG